MTVVETKAIGSQPINVEIQRVVWALILAGYPSWAVTAGVEVLLGAA